MGRGMRAWSELAREANGGLWCLGVLLEPVPLLSLNDGTGVSSAAYLDDLRSLGLVYIHLRTAFKARALCRLVQEAETKRNI